MTTRRPRPNVSRPSRGRSAATRSRSTSMIATIAGSADAAHEAVAQVAELEQISRRIDKIVDAISTVSIQTNMLAVNGSVEAAPRRRVRQGLRGGVDRHPQPRSRLGRQRGPASRIWSRRFRTGSSRFAGPGGYQHAGAAEVEQAKETTTRLETMTKSLVTGRRGRQGGPRGPPLRSAHGLRRGQDWARPDRHRRQPRPRSSPSRRPARPPSSVTGTEELAVAIEEIAALADELQSA